MSPEKELLHALHEAGLLEFGSVIPSELVHEVLGIEIPKVGSKAVFDELALRELNAIDSVRNLLLNQGKYLTACEGGYRILLPSENQKQVEAYMKSADRKLRRAQRLSANTPQTAHAADSTRARIHMKQHSRRRTLGEAHAPM